MKPKWCHHLLITQLSTEHYLLRSWVINGWWYPLTLRFFWFSCNQRSASQYVVYGRLMKLDDNLSLNLKLMSSHINYPLSNNLNKPCCMYIQGFIFLQSMLYRWCSPRQIRLSWASEHQLHLIIKLTWCCSFVRFAWICSSSRSSRSSRSSSRLWWPLTMMPTTS